MSRILHEEDEILQNNDVVSPPETVQSTTPPPGEVLPTRRAALSGTLLEPQILSLTDFPPNNNP